MDPKIIKALEMVLASMKMAAGDAKKSSFGKKPMPAVVKAEEGPTDDLPEDMKAPPDESGAGNEGDPAEEAAEPTDEEIDELLKLKK